MGVRHPEKVDLDHQYHYIYFILFVSVLHISFRRPSNKRLISLGVVTESGSLDEYEYGY